MLRPAWALVLAATSLGLAACHRLGEGGAADKAERPGTVAGATGNGGGSSQPGVGLQGGLGASAGMKPGQGTDVPEGSKNRTAAGSVGNR